MFKTLKILVIGAVALGFGVETGEAMDFDCEPLIKRAETHGETPDIKINSREGFVTMTTSFGSCRESVGARKFETQQKPKAAIAHRCSRQVAEVWDGDYYVIADTRYWLEQVFSVDTDRDGATDNIGFTLVTEKDDQAVRALAYYFSDDALQAQAIAGLALPKGVGVGDICFGQATFAAPVEQPNPAAFAVFDVPDLQSQLENQATARETASIHKGSKSNGGDALDLPIWLAALGGSTAVVGGSMLAYRKHRRKIIERKLFGEDDAADADD